MNKVYTASAGILAVTAVLFYVLYLLIGLSDAMMVSFIFVGLVMMLVILIQKPKGGGLSGAFGGAGGSSTAVFGSKVGDVLTWFTVGSFVIFLVLGMGLTWSVNYEVGLINNSDDETRQTTGSNSATAPTDSDADAAAATVEQQAQEAQAQEAVEAVTETAEENVNTNSTQGEPAE